MANWFSKLTLAVLTGVIIYWLTTGLSDEPAPDVPAAPSVSGYLVVADSGPVRTLDDLGAGVTVCGSKTTIEALRAYSPLARFNLLVLSRSELFQAYQTGICTGVLFRELAHANSVFPADLAGGRVIELRG